MLIYIGFWSAKIPAFATAGADTRSFKRIAVKRPEPEKCVLFATGTNCLTKIAQSAIIYT